jgi:hypothetical protein
MSIIERNGGIKPPHLGEPGSTPHVEYHEHTGDVYYGAQSSDQVNDGHRRNSHHLPHLPHIPHRFKLGGIAVLAAFGGVYGAVSKVRHDIDHGIQYIEHQIGSDTTVGDKMSMTPPKAAKEFLLEDSNATMTVDANAADHFFVTFHALSHGIRLTDTEKELALVKSPSNESGLQFSLYPLTKNTPRLTPNSTSGYGLRASLDIDDVTILDAHDGCETETQLLKSENVDITHLTKAQKDIDNATCVAKYHSSLGEKILGYSPIAAGGMSNGFGVLKLLSFGALATASNEISNLFGTSPQDIVSETQAENSYAYGTMRKFCGANLLSVKYLKKTSLESAPVWANSYIRTARQTGNYKTVQLYTNALKHPQFRLVTNSGDTATAEDIEAQEAKIPGPPKDGIKDAYGSEDYSHISAGFVGAQKCDISSGSKSIVNKASVVDSARNILTKADAAAKKAVLK